MSRYLTGPAPLRLALLALLVAPITAFLLKYGGLHAHVGYVMLNPAATLSLVFTASVLCCLTYGAAVGALAYLWSMRTRPASTFRFSRFALALWLPAYYLATVVSAEAKSEWFAYHHCWSAPFLGESVAVFLLGILVYDAWREGREQERILRWSMVAAYLAVMPIVSMVLVEWIPLMELSPFAQIFGALSLLENWSAMYLGSVACIATFGTATLVLGRLCALLPRRVSSTSFALLTLVSYLPCYMFGVELGRHLEDWPLFADTYAGFFLLETLVVWILGMVLFIRRGAHARGALTQLATSP